MVAVVFQRNDEKAEVLLCDFLKSEPLHIKVVEEFTEFLSSYRFSIGEISLDRGYFFMINNGNTFEHLLQIHCVSNVVEFSFFQIVEQFSSSD